MDALDARRVPRPVAAVGMAAVVLVVVAGAHRAIQASAQPAGGRVEGSGWWRADAGAGPAGALPLPVPPDGISVAASAGRADKVAAVGVALEVAPGALVERVVLRLSESAPGGSTVNSTSARVVACPITTPWSPTKDGEPARIPPADCGLGRAQGERHQDGTWEFDVTRIATGWASGMLPPYGVLLVEQVEVPTSFQVTWGDHTTGTISVDVRLSPAQAVESRRPTSGPPAGGVVSPGPARTGVPSGSAPEGDGAVATVRGEALPPASGAASSEMASGASVTGGEGEATAGRRGVPGVGDLPAATALLVPLVLGGAVLASYALGPAGDPAGTGRRRGPVSRALERRSDSGDIRS